MKKYTIILDKKYHVINSWETNGEYHSAIVREQKITRTDEISESDGRTEGRSVEHHHPFLFKFVFSNFFWKKTYYFYRKNYEKF